MDNRRNRNRKQYNEAWRLKTKNWWNNNPNKLAIIQRRATLKRCYGLTLDDFDRMVTSQNGNCMICGKFMETTRDRCVDHNHETNKVRDILCRACNTLLGNCRENTEILSNAINYLKKWNNGIS